MVLFMAVQLSESGMEERICRGLTEMDEVTRSSVVTIIDDIDKQKSVLLVIVHLKSIVRVTTRDL